MRRSRSLKVAIIGAGGMARILARIFKGRVSRIAIISRSMEKAKLFSRSLGIDYAPLDSVGEFDVMVLTPPPDALPEVVRRISPRLRAGSLVMDISSVKLGVVDEIASILPGEVEYLSIHPLFGSRARRLPGNVVVLIPVRGSSYLRVIRSVFESAGLRVVESTPEEHDRIMAYVQVAHHLSYLSLALTLWNGLGSEKARRLATRSLRRTFAMFELFHDNLKVIREIATLNRYGAEAVRHLKRMLDRLADGDPEAWAEVEKALRELSRP